MSTKNDLFPSFEFRKIISNPFQLSQLNILTEQWGCSRSDVCWRIIIEGFLREKKKRDEIEEIKKYSK